MIAALSFGAVLAAAGCIGFITLTGVALWVNARWAHGFDRVDADADGFVPCLPSGDDQ